MSLPPCFASASIEDVSRAIPLIALDAASLPKYLAKQPQNVRRWVATQDFKADANAVLLVPGGVEQLRTELLAAADWESARTGFGDPDLANQ